MSRRLLICTKVLMTLFTSDIRFEVSTLMQVIILVCLDVVLCLGEWYSACVEMYGSTCPLIQFHIPEV